MKRAAMSLLFAGCLLFAGSSVADVAQGDLSLLVDGTIIVASDGSVASYTLGQREKLPATVVDLVQKTVPAWHFKGVAGSPAEEDIKKLMSLRIVARPDGHGGYSAKVSDAYFYDAVERNPLEEGTLLPPEYPAHALRYKASAVVYVLVRIDDAGHVTHATTQQVNVYADASGGELASLQVLFAKAGLASVVRSPFPSVSSPLADRGSNGDHARFVRVPTTFDAGKGLPKDLDYGQWMPYRPGPSQSISWAKATSGTSTADIVGERSALSGGALMLSTPLE